MVRNDVLNLLFIGKEVVRNDVLKLLDEGSGKK
jgi:hypothetical protein